MHKQTGDTRKAVKTTQGNQFPTLKWAWNEKMKGREKSFSTLEKPTVRFFATEDRCTTERLTEHQEKESAY